MHFTVLGWPPDGPTFSLDHEQFAYAGKFVLSDSGKAVACEEPVPGDGSPDGVPDDLLGATAFSPDRTDPDRLRIRYITVRRDRRGDGIGSRLLRFTAERARDRGFSVDIAVNNPFAFQAASRAGFRYTGSETGIAELRLLYAPAERDPAAYRAGMATFADRDLPSEAAAFVADRRETMPPELVEAPE